MRITIIGAGYVGLTSAAVFAKLGHTVWAVRKDADKVEMLRRGQVPFYESGLPELVAEGVRSGRLIPTTSYAEAIPHAEVIFICVGTPPLQSGEADLSQVFAAAKEIAENWGPSPGLWPPSPPPTPLPSPNALSLRERGGRGEGEGQYKVVVNKSTVPVGTAQKVRKVIEEVLPPPLPPPLTPPRAGGETPRAGGEKSVSSPLGGEVRRGLEFDVASCPEFLREGSAVKDTLNPDRIVIGLDSDRARDVLLRAHEGLPGERVVTDIRTAEMIKYASNAFLATKISFINEMANLCDEVGANVEEVARGMGLDPRIGPAFLKAGIGYGGSCFPKDTRALHSIAAGHDYDFKLIKAVIEVNQQQRHQFLSKVRTVLGGVEGKKIGVLGLAFKNNTDDVRESAALDIISSLMKEGAQVTAYDPQAEQNAKAAISTIKAELLPNQSSALTGSFATCPSAREVADGADAVLVLTEWPEFRDLPWDTMKVRMRQPLLFDGRNLLDPKKMRELGFTYISVGRP